ncbi:hypothetical protein QFC21_000309 [Naganishia friedmannii]|uniref:Uncharacterized protein n=1 Tax=Naganishia friedmannii TaxID=89922 RepID=A0ACC2WDN8_9TREE|nr:hypothetical protein QFC21_000309 [Naganishia friedmannii]
MAASIASDNRPPYFHPASPANNSALQHCSTTEIQLASTSMTGIDGCMDDAESHSMNSRSSIFPALFNNTSMSMLDKEDGAGSLIEYVNTVDSHSYPALNATSNTEDKERSQNINDRQEHVASAARVRAFGLAKRLSGRSRTDSLETSHTSDSNSATRNSSRKDTDTTATMFTPASVPVRKTAGITTTFSVASPLPDMQMQSMATPSQPLITSTPLSKHLIAARSIMKEPNTPGSGQSVRFFSRDVYQTSSVADFESTQLDTRSSKDSPAGVIPLSNLDTPESILAPSRTSLSRENSTRRSIAMVQEPSYRYNESITSGNISETPPLAPIVAPDDSRITRRTASEGAYLQGNVHHNDRSENIDGTRQSDVFGDALAVVPQSSMPTFFPSSSQSAPSISVSPRSLDRSNSFRDASARSILGNSTQANVTVYPPGAYNRKLDIKGMRSSSPAAIQSTSNEPTAGVRSESTTTAPLREIIVLDDSSDFSASCANSTHINEQRKIDETVYLTPESSWRKSTTRVHSKASREADTPHDLSHSQASEEEVIEDVFSAHRRELAAIRKDRDGWKHLCTSLMEVTEASFSTGTPSGTVNSHPKAETITKSGYVQCDAQEPLETYSTITRSISTNSEKRRTDSSLDAAGVQLRDDLRDMQIRLESKQKECDQERSRADKGETQVEAMRGALVQMRQENDVLVRDTRDIDVKLELHARERESRVRQQLAEQMNDISSAFKTAQERNEQLLLITKQQQDGIEDLKLDLEARQRDLDRHRHLAHEVELQIERQSKLLQELGSEKEHVQTLQDALEDRRETIRHLELQLEEEKQARTQVTTQDEVQSLQEILAKEVQRNNDLSSFIQDKEKVIQDLKEDIEAQHLRQEKDLAARDQRIRELESAYNEQVKENRDQYLQLEEAIEEREAKYAERLGELEVISDGQEHEIQRLQARIEELQSESRNGFANVEDLRRTENELQERGEDIQRLSRGLAERTQKIKQYEAALVDLKRKAADDVFESTKRERRIEKLLDDREMLNIAVEQLQIQIQLVSSST